MPRGPRRDAPGAVHHVMLRGIARRAVFYDDDDRHDFLSRLARLLPEQDATCFGFSLMDNHVHMLIQTGSTPLSRLMARLGTGYARRFNARHARVGYLFQNRFRSDAVESDGHLLNLVRYVHRNPLDAGLVASLTELERYPWTGYPALLGLAPPGFLARHEVLRWFGRAPGEARVALRRWMADPVPGARSGAPPEDAAADILDWVCARLGLHPERVREGCRTRRAARARGLAAHLCRVRLGLGTIEIAAAFGVDEATVRRGLARGEEEARRWGLDTS